MGLSHCPRQYSSCMKQLFCLKIYLKSGDLNWLFITCLLPFSFKPFRDSCYIFKISLKPRILETFILEFKPRFPPNWFVSRAEDLLQCQIEATTPPPKKKKNKAKPTSNHPLSHKAEQPKQRGRGRERKALKWRDSLSLAGSQVKNKERKGATLPSQAWEEGMGFGKSAESYQCRWFSSCLEDPLINI